VIKTETNVGKRWI